MSIHTSSKMLTSSSPSSLLHRRPLTCSAARLVPHPPDLIRWVRREGGFVHPKINISPHTSLGVTITTADVIPHGEEIIALPSHLPLRFQHPGDNDHAAAEVMTHLTSRIPDELWAMRLGMRLLRERASVGSFWWPYISNLPEAFGLPIFFSGDEIKNLQYAPVLHQVNKRCRFLLEFEKEVKVMLEEVSMKDHPFDGQDVKASSLGWAMSAVSSRAFRLHGEILSNGEHSNVAMLLPLIDMCNHSFHPNARIVQEKDASSSKMLIKVVTEAKIEHNTPVTLNYGCLSNDLFLLDYGFVIPSNPYDHVELRYDGTLLDVASLTAGVSSSSFSSPAKWQQEYLSMLKLQGDGAILKVNIGGSELVDGRLLAALRVLLASDEKSVRRVDLKTLMLLSEEPPLGIPVETAVLRTVIALCIISLEHFPTKVMQDESILKGDISSAIELAIQFRMQKKLMIIDVMRNLTRRVKMLSEEKPSAQS